MITKHPTPHLTLRQWQESDTAPFIQMCADDDVIRYFLKKLNAEDATAFIQRLKMPSKDVVGAYMPFSLI
jgi:RimJ/RimL family protein N-acetyltransferase